MSEKTKEAPYAVLDDIFDPKPPQVFIATGFPRCDCCGREATADEVVTIEENLYSLPGWRWLRINPHTALLKCVGCPNKLGD